MSTARILNVEDDADNREFLQDAWSELDYSNPLLFLNNGEEVLAYLNSGKTVLFIFWPDEAFKAQIQKAYELGGNGFL